MNRKKKKFLKRLLQKTREEIWKHEFNVAIIENLVIDFSTTRLKKLKEQLATHQAKPEKRMGDKKKAYDILKNLKEEIKFEENAIKGANDRKESAIAEMKIRLGKANFLEEYIKGRYNK